MGAEGLGQLDEDDKSGVMSQEGGYSGKLALLSALKQSREPVCACVFVAGLMCCEASVSLVQHSTCKCERGH